MTSSLQYTVSTSQSVLETLGGKLDTQSARRSGTHVRTSVHATVPYQRVVVPPVSSCCCVYPGEHVCGPTYLRAREMEHNTHTLTKESIAHAPQCKSNDHVRETNARKRGGSTTRIPMC
jgi:hypothetical protein